MQRARQAALLAERRTARELTRREFVSYAGAALGGALFNHPCASAAGVAARGSAAADAIWGADGAATRIIHSLQHLSQAAFRAVDFAVTRYGAKPCRVVSQRSPYPDIRKSPVSAGCTLYFSPDPHDYAKDGPVDCGANGRLYYGRWQGNDCLNFGSPIYARNAQRIALSGEGPTSVLNGQGMTPFSGSGNASTCWWTYKGLVGKYGCVDASTPSGQYPN